MLLPALAAFDAIDMDAANGLLERWRHKMGPCRRPLGTLQAHSLRFHGEPVGVVVTADLVRETCAGLSRHDAIELARLCCATRDISRVLLRLWRLLIFPAYRRRWAVSYQDASLHSGDLYRFDGWKVIGHSRSGTDRRSNRRGRSKRIWGYEAAALVSANVQELPVAPEAAE